MDVMSNDGKGFLRESLTVGGGIYLNVFEEFFRSILEEDLVRVVVESLACMGFGCMERVNKVTRWCSLLGVGALQREVRKTSIHEISTPTWSAGSALAREVARWQPWSNSSMLASSGFIFGAHATDPLAHEAAAHLKHTARMHSGLHCTILHHLATSCILPC